MEKHHFSKQETRSTIGGTTFSPKDFLRDGVPSPKIVGVSSFFIRKTMKVHASAMGVSIEMQFNLR